MRRSAFAALALTGALVLPAAAVAQAPALSAAPSTRATVEVSLSAPRVQGQPAPKPQVIRVDYGQPHLRGRALHTGGLVPLDSVWRTGANSSTTFTTDVDLTVGGVVVPKGAYSLYSLPSKAGWKLIINRNTGQWGTEYDAKHDLARVDLTVRKLQSPVESFSIWLIPSTAKGPASGELRMAWGTTELAAPWSVK